MDNIPVVAAEKKIENRVSAEKIYLIEKRLENNNIINSFIITAIKTTAALPTGESKSIGWEAILMEK